MKIYYINEFINEYCELHATTKRNLFSKSRKRELVEKRMILSFFLRNRTDLTWQAIGKIMNKNHASIIHYLNKLDDLLDVYPHMQRMFKDTNRLHLKYKHLFSKEIDIYSQLLIDNEKLKNKIESNEKILKQLINLEND